MAINERDFYASHGISFDIEEMQIEYTKRVINQAKVEVLTELKKEFDKQCKIPNNNASAYDWNNGVYACYKVIQQKIDKLKGESDAQEQKKE